MKRLLIQPGANGDIFVCAPIAKYYKDLGYQVYWPSVKRFQSLIKKFDYVNHILLDEKVYCQDWLKSDVIKCLKILKQDNFDLILNLADRGPHPLAQYLGQRVQSTKYRISNVPFQEKYNLSWTRNQKKQNQLYDIIIGNKKEYSFVHSKNSRGQGLIPRTKHQLVLCREQQGYDITDWYKIINNASQIFCIDSSLQCFIDGFINQLKCQKYLMLIKNVKNITAYKWEMYKE